MSQIRQYIGARYVLKIYENSLNPLSADWEANVHYEPLTMVNFNNSSYISRKDVPPTVGNPVDNPAYWALSGLYNGQIAALQADIATIKDEMLNTRSLEMTKREFIWIGDSILANTNFSNIADDVMLYTGVNSSKYTQYAKNGAGFVTPSQPVTSRFSYMIDEVTVANPDDITDVLVIGGTNDITSSYADLLTEMQDFKNKVSTAYPNAQITIYFDQYRLNGGWADQLNYYQMRNAAKGLGIRMPDSFMLAWRDLDCMFDTIHPNQNGVNAIVDAIVHDLLGQPIVPYRYSIPWQITTAAGITFTNPIKYKQFGNLAELKAATNARIDLNEVGYAATSANFIEVGDVLYGVGGQGQVEITQDCTPSFTVPGWAVLGNTYYMANVIFRIMNGKLYVAVSVIDSNGTVVTADLTRIVILPFCQQLNTSFI